MKQAKKLAEGHWKYVKELLENHNLDERVIERIGFHYKTAFIHGYKHGRFENKFIK